MAGIGHCHGWGDGAGGAEGIGSRHHTHIDILTEGRHTGCCDRNALTGQERHASGKRVLRRQLIVG